MDTQVVELLGRNRLIDELLLAGLEVATPARDRGIDLIAYADFGPQLDRFVACPIQMKASSERSFSLDRKYEKFPALLMAYVWNLRAPDEAVTYALTFDEARGVAEEMGWTQTKSWANGLYSTTRPSRRLVKLLEPFRMTPERWWRKVTGLVR